MLKLIEASNAVANEVGYNVQADIENLRKIQK